jgi:hypothetical protein
MNLQTAIQDALGIPQPARKLIQTKSVRQSYEDMIGNEGLPLIEMLTFALVHTPIVYNPTGDTVGYVAYWWIDDNSAVYQLEGEWLKLLGMEQIKSPDGKQCEDLWNKYYHAEPRGAMA